MRIAQIIRALTPVGAAAGAAAVSRAMYADQVNALGAEVFAQQDANLDAIAKAAAEGRENQGKPSPGERCKTDARGGGDQLPPVLPGMTEADDEEPRRGAARGGLGKAISEGHAFDKHVLKKGEFKDLGITTRESFAKHIDDVVARAKGADVRQLSGGRNAYWDQKSGTVVIRNPSAPDMGTAFRPTNGRYYFETLK